jgi:hypothetical protein
MTRSAVHVTPAWHLSATDVGEIRKYLREVFETQSRRARDLNAMTVSWALAETVAAVPVELVEAYAATFEDLQEVRLQRALIASIGIGGWHPRSAAEWLERFVDMASYGRR